MTAPTIYSVVVWLPIESRPLDTGKYFVAHRGHVEVDHFFSPADKWAPHTKFGWQRVGPDGRHSWHPTHCALVPDLPLR